MNSTAGASESGGEPASRLERRATLAACCAVHGVQDGLTSTVYVLLPILAQHFGLSYASIGVIRAAHTTAMSLLEFPSTLLSERFGERRLLVFGLICSGMGYISLAFSGGYPSVLGALFLTGVGTAFQHSLSSSLVSGAFEFDDRRVALGTYNSSGDVGKLAATGLMSLLLGMGAGWQAVSGGYGAVALLGAAVLALLFRRLAAGSRAPATPRRSSSEDGSGNGIRDRDGFLALSAIVFLDTAVQDGFMVFVAFLMIEKQVPLGLAAFAVVLTLLGGVFGKFACGVVAARLGVVRSLVLVECLTALGIAVVYFSPSLLAFCLLPLVGTVLQGSSSINYGTVGELVDRRRSSRGFGIIYTTTSAAGILAPVLYGFLADRVGIGSAMMAMAITVLLPLPLCLVLHPALRRVQA